MIIDSDTTNTPEEPRPAQSSPAGPKLYQIQYTVKTGRHDPHERILCVAGFGTHGLLWMLTQEEAVMAINSGKLEFYVEAGGERQRVVVALSDGGQPYLKTETDGVQPNNLLDLPEYRWDLDAPSRALGSAHP